MPEATRAVSPAHPRSRGENLVHVLAEALHPGSSPLTRGKHSRVVAVVGSHRLIPAHAGKTVGARAVCILVAAHPRSRGENSCHLRYGSLSGGSSPLTRGKPQPRNHRTHTHRLIPAHAGKTLRSPCARTSPTAHPRSRGENSRRSASTARASGSSPLTRGKRLLDPLEDVRERLIPAHAGKTPTDPMVSSPASAHPRSRGENLMPVPSWWRPAGSSPLTRGKLAEGDIVSVYEGLIPAHAGKTARAALVPLAKTAHPRSRGENM